MAPSATLQPAGPRIIVVAAVNDEQVLAQNLMKSPMIADGTVPLIVERGHDSAGTAYNAAAKRAQADVIIFAHQDVYFPRRWRVRLMDAIQSLKASGTPWAVLGVWGVRSDRTFCGRVWCTGSGQEFSGRVRAVDEIASVDEIVIVVNAAAGLTFDEKLPGYHLYATDLVLQARQRGLKSFVFDAPVVHNSRTVPQLNRAYVEAYRYVQSKWQEFLPISTCVLPVTRFGWPLRKYRARVAINLWLKRVVFNSRHHSPDQLSRNLGYDG